MSIRSLPQLHRDLQAQCAQRQASSRAAGSGVASNDTAADSAPGAMPVIGRVVSVVTDSAAHGPHLIVAPQTLSGAPPVAADVAAPSVVCYPPPGQDLGAFMAGAYVLCLVVSGTRLAMKMS